MSYRIDQSDKSIVIDGWEKGIASSPYTGIANMRNVGVSYYPSVAYVNYRRQACSLNGEYFFAGVHSTNVSNNIGWSFTAASAAVMTNPVQKAVSPSGLNYILDDSGNIWKQSAINSSTFTLLGNEGRYTNGASGLAYWNNYLVVFGNNTIEFCGNGTGDSGITGSNWNLSPQTVAAIGAFSTGDYNYLSGTINQLTYSTDFTVSPTIGATSATLSYPWAGISGVINVLFTNTVADVRAVTFTNGSTTATWSLALSGTCSSASFKIQTLQYVSSPGATTFYQNDPVRLAVTSGSLPSPLTAGTTYYLAAPVTLTGGSPVILSATANGPFITYSSFTTGGFNMTDSQTFLPLKNVASVGVTFSGGVGSTTATLTSLWAYPSGVYNMIDPIGDNLQAVLTFNSTAVTFLNPTVFQPTGSYQVQLLNPGTNNRAYVSKVDGNLYFANGRWVGRIQSSPNMNAAFNPSLPQTYTVSYAATGTLQPQDTVVDMTDLSGKMIIAGNYDLYPWDYVSVQPSVSIPIGEQVVRIVNLLNNIYLTAGQKGNIYVSNGYSAQILYKIPDYIAGMIDPVWSFGDTMIHRAKLYFQALAKSTAGSNILAGVFSLNVSATLVTDVQPSGAFNMEAQNSTAPSTGALSGGCLMDNSPSSNGQDSYYSAYSVGTSSGVIDYNDTTLWQNNEPMIETDIIPIGTYLIKKTLAMIQFKLDRPLATGDSISLYWRPSLTDSYVSIPVIDTSANLLSNYGVTSINQAQWAQFKVTFKCASSGSSFIPLREIRIQYD